MGRDSNFNPVDAARKKEKQKDLKRNRDLRKQHREAALKKMTSMEIQQEIDRINGLERRGLADQHQLQRRKKLQEELTEARNRDEVKIDEKTGKLQGSRYSRYSFLISSLSYVYFQARRAEERKKAAEQQTVVVKGLEDIVGSEKKEEEKDSKERQDEKQNHTRITDDACASPVNNQQLLSSHPLPRHLRPWLEAPPGLKRPPYQPTLIQQQRSHYTTTQISPQSYHQYTAQNQLSTPSQLITKDDIIHIPMPDKTVRGSAKTADYTAYTPPPPSQPRSHPRYPSHAVPEEEIDPMDPNPETARDYKHKKYNRGNNQQLPNIADQTTTTSSSLPTSQTQIATTTTTTTGITRSLPTPTFIPTSVLVRNRVTSLNKHLSMPSGSVNPAPTVGPDPSYAPNTIGAEYDKFMREVA